LLYPTELRNHLICRKFIKNNPISSALLPPLFRGEPNASSAFKIKFLHPAV
jgi:hypothetical protein